MSHGKFAGSWQKRGKRGILTLKNKRDYLAREIQRKALNEDVYNFIGYMKMSFVMKNNVSGINPHPTDYYQFNANTNIE